MKLKLLFTLTFSGLVCYAVAQDTFYGISDLLTSDSKQPVINVVLPNGGESLSYSDPLTINWAASDDSFGPTPIAIGISTTSGGTYTIVASNLPNSGTAIVNPPDIPTSAAKVCVIAHDGYGLEGNDVSNNYFTFSNSFSGLTGALTCDSKPPVVTLVKPNGGETYYFADSLQVEWNAMDDSFGSNPVSISLSTDGGTNYTVLSAGLPNSSQAYVIPPEMMSDIVKAKVLVQDEYGLSAFDESDAVFSLQGLLVDLKAFLEGPFVGTGMLTYLNSFGYLPLTQPYSVAPWLYSGTESVASIPNSNVVDWVLVELRDAPDAGSATSATRIAQQAGFVLQNGQVTSMDGSSSLQFGVKVNQGLYAVVSHRNHLPVMSASTIAGTGNLYSYDFSIDASQAYGGVNAHKQVESGVWGMSSGDGNADKQITTLDKINVWQIQTGASGYNTGDFNLDGQVDNNDKNLKWRPNVGRSSQVPE